MPKYRVPVYAEILVEATDEDDAAVKVEQWLGKDFIADPPNNLIGGHHYLEAGYGEFEKIEVHHIPTRKI